MVKELERAGIPAVLLTTLSSLALSVGANRIVPTLSIKHPLGDPSKPTAEEKKWRRRLIQTALSALQTKIEDQTVFEPK
jgi:glycine reductase